MWPLKARLAQLRVSELVVSVRSKVAGLWPTGQGTLQSSTFQEKGKSGTKRKRNPTTQNRVAQQAVGGPSSPFYSGLASEQSVLLPVLHGLVIPSTRGHPASKLAQPLGCNQTSLPSREAAVCCSASSALKGTRYSPFNATLHATHLLLV